MDHESSAYSHTRILISSAPPKLYCRQPAYTNEWSVAYPGLVRGVEVGIDTQHGKLDASRNQINPD